MPKVFKNILGIIFLGFFVVGCGVTKGVKVQTYFEDKPRVDQDLPYGNQGFLGGSGKNTALPERKLTRKVFVVEVSKEALATEEVSKKTCSECSSVKASSQESDKKAVSTITTVEPNVPVVNIAKTEEEMLKPSYVEYVVDKDDTLQKIAKKFYDNYNKWTKIYEANKSLIKNPDRIQPGITLRIPME
ncbi:MAG TPA: LysM peptidoglycan-binding domain-containing protein [Candidatus Omnitrophota bacterium]|nr:LysM peptidoglycan-binding domain-containing protein [Candidatus Omnitrophota bacterium]HPN88532.1 LysM peptidoglycan-binding domain-containing protein [Candidatus Omnitrophota bacterium]